MGRRLTELNTATNLFPGDLFLIDNQGTSRKATLQQIAARVFGINTQGTRRSAKIVFDNQGFVTSITNGLLTGGGTLTFPEVGANAEQSLTLNVSGAEVGDCVSLALPAAFPAGLSVLAWVTLADTVTIRLRNHTGAGITPPAATYNVVVHKL
jgi:hypothetical protein